MIADQREGWPTAGGIIERFLGPDDYALATIAPGLWTGFKGLDEVALVGNCATHPHDASRTERLDPFDDRIPYQWDVRHR